MPSEIVGYADRAYIKGQYWRYAAAPKPSTFTGDIDEVSEDLLAKAMFVSRSQAAGTFPDDMVNNYLIETVKYGNSSYLQIAYAIQSGYDCYEYKRIYSGAWTNWISVDGSITSAINQAKSAEAAANQVAQSITGDGGINSQISGINGRITGLNQTVDAVSRSVNGVASSVSTLNDRTTMVDISGNYTVEKTGGESKWSFISIEAKKINNVVNMSFNIHMSSGSSSNTWSAGTNLFKGQVTKGSLPIYGARLLSYYGPSIILCNITASGEVTVRVFGGSLVIGNRSEDLSTTGMFMITT